MVEFGLNVNNREPLLRDDYGPQDMFSLAETAERVGFDSVWVGDSLLQAPRLDPLNCLATIADRTEDVRLGTCCLITPLRNPIRLAQQWGSLDMFSDGRMILGACMGTTGDERGKRQYEVVGIPPKRRARALREGLEVLDQLWREGRVDYDGEIYQYEDVTFDTGSEVTPLGPMQDDPPVWVVSNPSAGGGDTVHSPAIRRVVDAGNGWITCCRAQHPDEFEKQWDAIAEYAEEAGTDPDDITATYQITTNIADSEETARRNLTEYVEKYQSQDHYNLDEWGPIGTADEIIDWVETFEERGCDHVVVRFGAFEPEEQLRRFANEVLPSFS